MYAETSGVAARTPDRMYRSCVRIGNVSIGVRADSADDVELTREMKRIPDDSHRMRYRHKRSMDGSLTKDGWKKAL